LQPADTSCDHAARRPASHGRSGRFSVVVPQDAAAFVEHLEAEDPAFDGEPASLAVVEGNSFLSKLLPEYLILSEEVFEYVLLPAIDPAGEDEEQQVTPARPWASA
jgi:hypothetical protein